MLRVGMLSGWHVHAKGYANELRDLPDAEIAAVWDEDPDRGAEWAADLGAPFDKDIEAFLGREDMDGVVVCAPTNRHPEVMVAAARANKHIFTEKVMALTVAECDAIAIAVREAGVKFCISFPARTSPGHLFAKQAIDDGILGDVTLARVRVAHDGASAGWLAQHFWDPETCGGGAMMDLGAHPMYLLRWLLGQPVRISSTFNHVTGQAVEDNAVSVIEFANKAIGVSETSFVSTHAPPVLEIHGTEGAVFVGGPDDCVRIRSRKLEGAVEGWVSPANLPDPLPKPIPMWVRGVLDDAPIPFGLDEGAQLTELMENAYRSHREQRQVEIVDR